MTSLSSLFLSLLLLTPGTLVTQAPQAPLEEAQNLVPERWLVLPRIDHRGRRPFRPDAVLRRLLLGAEPLPVVPGDGAGSEAPPEWEGETDSGVWRSVETGERGKLEGAGNIGYAVTEIHVPEDGVWLARIQRAAYLIVDDTPYAGDYYGYGWRGVPVALSKGTHRLILGGLRGTPRVEFAPLSSAHEEGGILLAGWDATLPSLIEGDAGADEMEGAVIVMNVRNERTQALRLESVGEGSFLSTWGAPFRLHPLEVLKLPVPIARRAPLPEGEGKLPLTVRVVRVADGVEVARHTYKLQRRGPLSLHRRTFRSRIDDSVQEYCVLPPKEGGAGSSDPKRFLLSLHGASVHAWNQAASYAQLPDFWIAAATNRRPFGFDWQDWGRSDAYEVLEQGLALSGVARSRVYLGGHSMGGHGTWHLGANDPDGFAALAPSAGWRSFDTYGGRPQGALRELWHGADGPSLTEGLVSNLIQLPTYVLHSDKDESVPVSEAQEMVEFLEASGGSPALHIEEGKGHWWDSDRGPGADCLAWPEFFELFRSVEIPEDPASIDFMTADPVVDADHHWVSIDQPLEYGRFARVRGANEGALVRLETENVRRLRVRRPAAAEVEIDGVRLPLAGGEVEFLFEGGWRIQELVEGRSPALLEKRPDRSGPFKRAFGRRFVVVVPTGGSELENRRAFERARYDAQVWWYRGNGRAPILTDDEFLAPARERDHTVRNLAGRNVILYGNATTNLAWDTVVGATAPLRVERGHVTLRGERYEGEGIGALFCLPRADDGRGLVGVLATTGARGELVAPSLGHFISGVGYPDYVVFDERVLEAGDGGVLSAGWFDHTWR